MFIFSSSSSQSNWITEKNLMRMLRVKWKIRWVFPWKSLAYSCDSKRIRLYSTNKFYGKIRFSKWKMRARRENCKTFFQLTSRHFFLPAQLIHHHCEASEASAVRETIEKKNNNNSKRNETEPNPLFRSTLTMSYIFYFQCDPIKSCI